MTCQSRLQSAIGNDKEPYLSRALHKNVHIMRSENENVELAKYTENLKITFAYFRKVHDQWQKLREANEKIVER